MNDCGHLWPINCFLAESQNQSTDLWYPVLFEDEPLESTTGGANWHALPEVPMDIIWAGQIDCRHFLLSCDFPGFQAGSSSSEESSAEERRCVFATGCDVGHPPGKVLRGEPSSNQAIKNAP